MYTIRTSIELPIAHCLSEGAYTGLCVGNIARDGKKVFDLSGGLLNVLHGHNYIVTVDLSTEDEWLDKTGMVVDFKLMKKIIHSYFDKYDHSMILTKDNPLTEIYRKNYAEHGIDLEDTRVFVWDSNPTAERMAMLWHKDLSEIFNSTKENCKYNLVVSVEETSNNTVTYKK